MRQPLYLTSCLGPLSCSNWLNCKKTLKSSTFWKCSGHFRESMRRHSWEMCFCHKILSSQFTLTSHTTYHEHFLYTPLMICICDHHQQSAVTAFEATMRNQHSGTFYSEASHPYIQPVSAEKTIEKRSWHNGFTG